MPPELAQLLAQLLDLIAALIAAMVFFLVARNDLRDRSPRLALVGAGFCSLFLAHALLAFFP